MTGVYLRRALSRINKRHSERILLVKFRRECDPIISQEKK
jgi:hypothetical protein